MTDRICGFWVALEEDVREEDIEPTIAAVKQIKNVLAVERRLTVDPRNWIEEERVRRELGQKLLEIVFPKMKVAGL